MNGISFSEKVKKYFQYLEQDYSFKRSREDNSELRPETDGLVEYSSNTTVVVIDSEMSSPSLWFYRIADSKKYYLDPFTIHEYLNTDSDEKKLLLSTNPQDKREASILITEKSLLMQPEWVSKEDKLEARLVNYAKWLREHANLCLTDDFSLWPSLYEYKIHRMRADHLRRGKDELSYARVQDAKGDWILSKQSIFKDQLEHIEKLKKEFSS